MCDTTQMLVLFAALFYLTDVSALRSLNFRLPRLGSNLSMFDLDSPFLGFDFRPDKFIRERYARSRAIMEAKRLGLRARSDISFESLHFMALVNEFDYPAEEHLVTTKDGYRLRLHRIPGSAVKPKAPGKPVVFFQHGILASSDTWILMGPNQDLAYMLVDAGFDVWFGNARGNTYSRSHIKLSPDNHPEFWQFSFHEIGMYDVPAFIDYILGLTKQRTLVYVGHSMGTSVSYVLLSMKPEYNEKISLVVSLAPVAFWDPSRPLAKFLIQNADAIVNYLTNSNMYEVFPLTAGSAKISRISCSDGSIFQKFCKMMIYAISGYNPAQLNSTLLPKIFSLFPAGASAKTLFHYSQNQLSGYFRTYDYGTKENLRRYNQINPPIYNLSNIVPPVGLFYGIGDAVVSPKSVMKLAKMLPNVKTVESVPDHQFSHLDFLFSQDVRELLNERIMEFILNTLRYENEV